MSDSIWLQQITREPSPPLRGNIRCDVLVIGGGLTGILTARALTDAGVSCIVIEASTLASGTTGGTTAKITAQHGLIYADLIKRFGTNAARLHYDACTRAIEEYSRLSERFPCSFERKTAFVYTTEDTKNIEHEAEAYNKLGIGGQVVTETSLPFKVNAALSMENQAQFDPLPILYGLADCLQIYENTHVRKIQGGKAYTDSGMISASNIVLATRFPFVNIPGLYFVKMHQHRGYAVALKNAQAVGALYRDEKADGLSFRDFGDKLILGGGAHKTGSAGCGGELREFAARYYPDAELTARWAAQDCMTLDGLPYIGRHRRGTRGLYVATGYGKWGMTGAMTASRVLTDLITRGMSELEPLYLPYRSIMRKQLWLNLGNAVKNLATPGSPRCAHMGCKLKHNDGEKSWDCPCHGSRFDESGRLLDSPAKHGLKDLK